MTDDGRKLLRQEIFRPREQTNASSINSDLLKLFPPSRLASIKRRELRRFRQRQDVKWSKWLQAVSE